MIHCSVRYFQFGEEEEEEEEEEGERDRMWLCVCDNGAAMFLKGGKALASRLGSRIVSFFFFSK